MTTFETDLLAELIGRRCDCLRELRDMGRWQLELIGKGTMTELLDLLSTKQRLLGELQRIERGLDPFRGQDPQARRWRSPERRQQCARQLEECESLVEEIVDRERQSERELTRRRDEVAAQLQGLHRAGQARGAYTAQPGPGVSQIDLSSES